MVEALRTQQQSTSSDDRITLADLTLVAVASATQQMAASASSPSGAARSSGGNHGGGEARQEERRDPEAERVYIDEIAREVVDEIRQQFRAAHERSGRNWET